MIAISIGGVFHREFNQGSGGSIIPDDILQLGGCLRPSQASASAHEHHVRSTHSDSSGNHGAQRLCNCIPTALERAEKKGSGEIGMEKMETQERERPYNQNWGRNTRNFSVELPVSERDPPRSGFLLRLARANVALM